MAKEDKPTKDNPAVKHLLSRIQCALKDEKRSKQLKDFEKNRNLVKGFRHGVEGGTRMRTNLINSQIATTLPQIYAKNPDIAVNVSGAVDEAEYDKYEAFATTLELVLHRKFVKEAKLKKRATSTIKSTLTTAYGWAKMIYQEELGKDPVIQSRINDLQDNLAEINRLKAELQEGDDDYNEKECTAQELQNQINTLQAGVERVRYRGLVIDAIRPEDMLILDDTLSDLQSYEQAGMLVQIFYLTEDAFEREFGRPPQKGAVSFHKKNGKNEASSPSSPGESSKEKCLYRVFEAWSLRDGSVCCVCEGENVYAREPAPPPTPVSRFYPYFLLCFNTVDSSMEAISDVTMMEALQEEYEVTRDQFADHRKDSMPVRMARKGGNLTDEDIKRIQNRKTRDVVMIEGNPSVPISQDIFEFPAIKMDPAVYDTGQIRADIELVMGTSDAARGNVTEAKTATEAEIMAQGMSSRADLRRDLTEDWLTEMAESAAQILVRKLSREDVIGIAGEGAVWADLDVEHAFSMVQIEIRAGSTGKPNKTKEEQTWTQLLPVIKEAIQAIGELRMNGQNQIADALSELLKETMKRFDERMDVEKFLPKAGEQPADPMQDPKVQQFLAQAKEAMQRLEQENEQLKNENASMKADRSIEQAKASADAQLAARKQEQDMALEQMKAEFNRQLMEQKAQTEANLKILLARIDAATKIEVAEVTSAAQIQSNQITAAKQAAEEP